MKPFPLRAGYFTLLALFLLSFVRADIEAGSSDDHLFKIERSRDADAIYYDINFLPDGKLNLKDPIDIYWIRHTENGQREALDNFQRKLGYGINILHASEQGIDFKFVSFSGKSFTLKKTNDQQYRVVTRLKNQEVVLNKLYIQFKNDSYWFPNITRIDLHGTDLVSGRSIVEKLPQ